MVNAKTEHLLTQFAVVFLYASGPSTIDLQNRAWFAYFSYVLFACEPCARKRPNVVVLGSSDHWVGRCGWGRSFAVGGSGAFCLLVPLPTGGAGAVSGFLEKTFSIFFYSIGFLFSKLGLSC